MCLKLNAYFGIYSMMNIQSSLLLNLPSSTSLCSFMLVPFSFRKSELIADSHYQDFRVIFIENDSTADGLVLLQPSRKLEGINLNKLWTVLLKLEKEFIALTIAVFDLLFAQDKINVVVECFLCMIAESAGVSQLFLRQVQHKFAEHTFEEFSLPLHQLLQDVETKGRGMLYVGSGWSWLLQSVYYKWQAKVTRSSDPSPNRVTHQTSTNTWPRSQGSSSMVAARLKASSLELMSS